MTDFGKRAGEMLKSVYDSDEDGVIAVAQTEADMKKSVYDSNDDGVVADSDKLGASSKTQVQDHTPKSHAHAQADVTGLVAALAGKSATGHGHTESDISNLDHNAQKIKGVIINDAAIGDQKVLAYDLATERIVYITPAPSGALIKSIQSGYMSIQGTATTETFAISSVDVTKSIIQKQGTIWSRRECRYNTIRCELTDPTTITATRPAGTAGTNTPISFSILEFDSGVKSIAHYVHTDGMDLTITEVDPDKTLISYRGCFRNTADLCANYDPMFYLLNGTTLHTNGADYITYYFTVLEFD